MHAALAIVAALLNRFRHGEGAYLDVAATDGVLSLMSLYLDQYTATGVETKPDSGVLTGKYAWYGVYRTADDKAISLGAIEPHFFRNLCRLLELEQYSGSQYDDGVQEAMKAAFAQKFATRRRDDWTALLAAADTCMAPVLSVAEVVEDPHLLARDTFMLARHPEQGEFRQLGPVLAGGERGQPVHEVKPAGVTDTDEVLRGAGVSDADIERWRASGAIE